MSRSYLIDTSAAARVLRCPSVAEVIAPIIRTGSAATCGVLDLEALHSAESVADFDDIRWTRRHSYTYLHSEDEDFARAVEVKSLLAGRGQLRSVGLADLLVAAIAERHRVVIVHYDSDFDTIADVTGQPCEWVVPRGSVF